MSLRNIVEPSYPVGYIGSLYLLEGNEWVLYITPLSFLTIRTYLSTDAGLLHSCLRG